VIAGALVALLEAIGLVRMESFYERVHPPTMVSSMGVGLITLTSMICFSVLRGRVSVHEILIVVFITHGRRSRACFLVVQPYTATAIADLRTYRAPSEGSAMTSAGPAHQAFDRGATLSSQRPSGPAPHARDW
jgi:monovalent cation/proton antiporter MnhG/PhaG subunit